MPEPAPSGSGRRNDRWWVAAMVAFGGLGVVLLLLLLIALNGPPYLGDPVPPDELLLINHRPEPLVVSYTWTDPSPWPVSWFDLAVPAGGQVSHRTSLGTMHIRVRNAAGTVVFDREYARSDQNRKAIWRSSSTRRASGGSCSRVAACAAWSRRLSTRAGDGTQHTRATTYLTH